MAIGWSAVFLLIDVVHSVRLVRELTRLRSELGELDVKVDILHPAHKVNGLEDLDAQRYGVIVQSGWKRGLLLPALEGVDTPEQQVSIAMRKGGIAPSEKIELYRFEVERHEDK